MISSTCSRRAWARSLSWQARGSRESRPPMPGEPGGATAGALTEGPTAGQTMAAMAGALRVTLEKHEHYRLGAGAPPDVAAIDRSVRVFAAAAGLGLVAALVVLRAWR